MKKIITSDFSREDLEFLRLLMLKLLAKSIDEQGYVDCADFSFPFEGKKVTAHIEFEVGEVEDGDE